MPYKIRKRNDKWEVINEKTGKVKGVHDIREKAIRHLRALYVNVKDAALIVKEYIKNLLLR